MCSFATSDILFIPERGYDVDVRYSRNAVSEFNVAYIINGCCSFLFVCLFGSCVLSLAMLVF